jgi:hypothetical protein
VEAWCEQRASTNFCGTPKKRLAMARRFAWDGILLTGYTGQYADVGANLKPV